MSNEQTPSPEQAPAPAWGDQQPPARRWSGRKTAIAAAVAVGIAAAGGVAVYAGTSAAGTDGRGGMQGGRFAGPPGGMIRTFQALHGDFVASDGNGGYSTQRMQTGEVTAIDTDSITMTSEDGYTQSYLLDGDTAVSGERPEAGDERTVVAEVDGDTATALTVSEPRPAGGPPDGMGRRPNGQAGN
ncbi:hypothetical protein [Amycolatopsis aidingensis]|uniref:hypothetical protein n=1 Tax=Amycolatopsis aidingensis TaxID=2842453 RepID=UPI001C0AC167|nr:hypothetical protein [Amycolatopsis aidingensis]